MIGRTNAGFGAGINFKVVGGTVQPQGKENLIWVNTSTPILFWAVSTIQPESAFDGMVWIVNGTENGINILKKNAMELYPSGCRMYRNGKWEDVESFLFRNGEWVRTAAKYYIVKDGFLQNGAIVNDKLSEGYQYDGRSCLALHKTNGGNVFGEISNITVPAWAKTLHMHLENVNCFEYAVTYTIYGIQITVSRGQHTDEYLTLDVTSAAGKQTVLTLHGRGYSGHATDFFGDIWFD